MPRALYLDFVDQEALDAQYQTSRQVVDGAGLLAQRVRDSDRARAELRHLRDVPYGPTRAERLDIYPAAQPGAPMVMFVHGGYWSTPGLTKGLYAWVAQGLAPHGITTLVIDYAVCPDQPLDELVRQCRAAVAWTAREAASFGGDAAQLYLTGHSAGGHLVSMAGLTDWAGDYDLPADTVKGCMPISGLFDLAPFPYTWLQPKLQLTQAQIERHSPLTSMRAGTAPQLIAWGALETPEFHRQASTFHAACTAHGVASSLLPLEGCLHNSAIDGFADPQSALCRALVAHMRECGVLS
jgi:arylformamidase